jgi:hypothetical protein
MIARRLAVAAVAVAILAVPWLSPWPNADLSNIFSDHLRHAFVAKVALAKGADVYRLPLAEAGQGVEARHPGFYWAAVPYAYPPGALLLFLPVSLFSEAFIDAQQTHARLLVSFTALLAILAMLAVWRALQAGQPFERWLFVVFAFGQLIHVGLEGFYDPAWVALGALAVVKLRKGAPGAALWLCVAAAAVHLRAVVLLPVAAVALHRLKWRHPALAAGAVVALVDVAIFFAVRPYAELFRDGSPALTSTLAVLFICVAISAVAAGLCLWSGKPLAAATIGMVLLLAAVDVRGFWHATVVLIPLLLAAGPAPSVRKSALVAALLVLWAVQLQRFAWGGRAWDLPRGVAYALTNGGVERIP